MTEKLVERPVLYKREQKGTLVQEFDDSRVKNYWRRHKKATVDLLELPVAVDRQLEDQRITMEYNRNPRLHIPTKVDKVRSEQIIAKQGASRDVGIKAKVVNKIVREASGVHSYVIVPPPRKKGEVIELDPDPETNPFVALYAKETKKKPVIVSFGHRPRSASRVFNPGTMRVKMKHDEIAKAPSDHNKFQFGLPVGILGKILKAPHISNPTSLADEVESQQGSLAESVNEYDDPHDLFSLPPGSPGATHPPEGRPMPGHEPQTMPSGLKKGFGDESLTQGGSWVSGGSTGGGSRSKGKKKTSIFTEKLSPMKESVDPIDRPAWDTAHNVIPPQIRQKEVYALKANHINANKFSLSERLTRFNAKTIADELTPYCTEKQQNDFHLLQGDSKPTDVQKSSAYYNDGLMALSDPLNGQLIQVKKNFNALSDDLERKHKAQDFQRSIQEIPKVAYHPKTLLTQMQQGNVTLKQIGRLARAKPQSWEQGDFYSPEKGDGDSVNSGTSQSMASRDPPSVYTRDSGSATSSAYFAGSPPVKHDAEGHVLPEARLYNAMRRAKHGNQRSLYNLFMGEKGRDEGTAGADQSFELMHVPAGGGGGSVGSNFGTMIQSAEYPAEGAEHGHHHHHHHHHHDEGEGEGEDKPGSRPFSGLEHEIEAGEFFQDAGSFESMGVGEGETGDLAADSIDKENTRAEGHRHSNAAGAGDAEGVAETKQAEEEEVPVVKAKPELHITIKSATGLSPANMFGGSSDPYVSVWDQGNAGTKKKDEIWRTGHIDSTLEPQWGTPPGSGETFSFPIEELRPKTASADEEYHDRSKYKTYRLDVMDYNKMTKEVFLGAVYLSPEHYHCEEGEERQEDYEWELEAHDVRSTKENKLAKGKLSFSIRFVYK